MLRAPSPPTDKAHEEPGHERDRQHHEQHQLDRGQRQPNERAKHAEQYAAHHEHHEQYEEDRE